VGFVVDKAAVGQVFLRVLQFPLSVSFHQGSILVYVTGDEQDRWMPQFTDIASHPIHMMNNNPVIMLVTLVKVTRKICIYTSKK
jgi:hypothetical protein